MENPNKGIDIESIYSTAGYHDAVRRAVLPQWLEQILPEAPEPAVIEHNADTGTYSAIHPEEGSLGVFDTIESAYDAMEDAGYQFSFSDSVEEKHGRVVSVPTEDGKWNRMLLPRNEQSKLNRLKSAYLMWWGIAEAYLADPHDFIKAYEFLDGHPCFWTHMKSPNSDDTDFTFTWETDSHALRIWHRPVRNNDGNTVFMMETGAHVPESYTEHYHDLRLDVSADSYENAIIETAAKVHKFFHLDGSDREGVEYEKSELEEILDERVKDLEERLQG